VSAVNSATQITLTNNATESGSMTLTIGVEPVTLAQLKRHARVDITEDDVYLAGLIRNVREFCEGAQNRAYLNTVFDARYCGFPVSGGYYNRAIREMGPSPLWLPSAQGLMQLPRPPLVSVTSITYIDTGGISQVVDPSLYNVSPGSPGWVEAAWGQTWPLPRNELDSVTIRFVAGYGADPSSVPGTIQQVILLLAGHWYENREPILASGVIPLVKEIPYTVQSLLANEKWGAYS
jgi:hypothetical protein